MSFFDLNNDSSTQDSLLSCQECGKSDASQLKVCNQCLVTSYCSRECQREDWPLHRELCALIAANGDVGEKRDAPAAQAPAKRRRRPGQVAEGVTGIFFDRTLDSSPVEVNGSKDVRRYQFLHPAWPDVTQMLVVTDRFDLPLPSRESPSLRIEETFHYTLFHYFQWAKFRSIGDNEYAERLRKTKDYFDVEQASLLETYASHVVASELNIDEALRVNTTQQIVLRRLRVALELRWTPYQQIETLRRGITVIYDPTQRKPLTDALLSTGNVPLHLHTRIPKGDLFSLNPFTGNGGDWLGRLLMERRDALNLQVTAPEEPGISQAGLVLIRDNIDQHTTLSADDLKRPIGRAPLKVIFSTYLYYSQSIIKKMARQSFGPDAEEIALLRSGDRITSVRTVVGDNVVTLEWLVKQFNEVWQEWRSKGRRMDENPKFAIIKKLGEDGDSDEEELYDDDSDEDDNIEFSTWVLTYLSSITYEGQESDDF